MRAPSTGRNGSSLACLTDASRMAGVTSAAGSPAPLPDRVNRNRWTLEGRRLQFTLLGEKPCGGRADILADATYERVG